MILIPARSHPSHYRRVRPNAGLPIAAPGVIDQRRALHAGGGCESNQRKQIRRAPQRLAPRQVAVRPTVESARKGNRVTAATIARPDGLQAFVGGEAEALLGDPLFVREWGQLSDALSSWYGERDHENAA